MSHQQAPACPLCPGEGVLLGALGSTAWFRCRQCGMDFSRTRRRQRLERPSNRTVAPTQERAA